MFATRHRGDFKLKSWSEIRNAATAFSKRWKDAYDEKSQAESFLKEFFAVFGVDAVTAATFEHRVKFADGSQGYTDCTGAVGSVYDAIGRQASRNADTFGYNARSEVTSHSPAGFWQHSYSYDEIGNSASVPANSLNQYVSGDSYDYDADGNMTFCDYNIQLDYDARATRLGVGHDVHK